MNFYLFPFLKNGGEISSASTRSKKSIQHIDRQNFPAASSRTIANLFMKLNIVILVLGILLSQANARSLAQEVSLNKKNSSLESILKDLEKQSGYTFFYNRSEVNTNRKISIHADAEPLRNVLTEVLKGQPLVFDFFDKTIVIKKADKIINDKPVRTPVLTQQIVQQQMVRGVILDEDGNGIVGASIRLKSNPKNAVSSSQNGEFVLPITSLNEILVISYLGFESREVKASLNQKEMRIVLTKQNNTVDEVVVTGMMTFKKETFSGATVRFEQEELKQVANTNVIQAIKSLDPSFLVMENNLAGANPNVLPTIELRGQTSITSDNLRDEFTNDPNQPLFILDGFQTSLRTIMDLDMNRIASISIHKDAASTAIYGSRASNGVVVVETIKPKPGEVLLSYSADLNLEIADLGSYNMMNAAEILEFERLSGLYTAPVGSPETQHSFYDPLYNMRKQRVLSGIDTYWLKEPIKTGFAHRHALYAEGGSENFIFNVGGNYKNNSAVMKGSGREDWGARANLTYRKNRLNVNNNLTIHGYDADQSIYGSFATWANMKPYYQKDRDQSVYLENFLDEGSRTQVVVRNPLYNTRLNSFDYTKSWGITNNLQLIFDINKEWRVQSSMQVNRESISGNAFVSPLHSQFIDQNPLLKGRYTAKSQDLMSYTANAMVGYTKVIDKHSFNANARIEFSEESFTSNGFISVGFPTSSNGSPSFAFGYEKDGKPSASKSIRRRNSLISTANYSYDNRYNVDASFNYDGSTSFGRQNLYSPFFALGASWNIHNEAFLKGNPTVNLLRLRANYGVTGNQNFNSSTSISTYQYLSAYNYGGQGVALATFANENLRWQKTNQWSTGIDATLFENRLNLTLNAYQKITNDLAVAVDLPASTGLLAYPFNAGDLNVRGVELTAKYNVIHRPHDHIVWNIGLTGARSNQIYENFNDLLAGLNQSLQNSNSLIRYRDGYSPNTLWAVVSNGIDPTTGREVFLKKNGQQTFDYSVQDIVAIGNGNPTLQGILSTNLNYKGFTFAAYMRYIWDQDVLNSALFNKVENISKQDITNYNQDKRALYERWKNPGDVSQFRAISITDNTPISSRFIQQENTVSLESISLGYDFRDKPWISKMGLSSLRVTGLTNEVFRWSTVKRERGIDYPYAKMYSISVNAKF